MKTQALSVDLLQTDADTQNRSAINEDAAGDYADLITESDGKWPFPPLDVFHDDAEYFVSDGFHRLLGAKQAERGSVPCIVHKGTARDARIFGMTANDTHGLRLSRAERRENVEWLLDNGGKMTQKAVAEKAGVTTRTVKMIVANRNPVSIAGKAPPKQDGEGKISPTTSGGGEQAVQFDDDFPDTPDPPPASSGNGKPINALTGREHDVFEAKQVLKTWADAVGRWMNGNPAGIDVYREKFPGKPGDRVIDAAKELYNAIEAWKRGLK